MAKFHFRCSECGTSYGELEVELVCPSCSAQQVAGHATRGVLDVEIEDLPTAWPGAGFSDPEVLAAFLPIAEPGSLPPLAAGGTPLLAAARLRRRLDLSNLWIKDDTRNPSGSTKDRASALVVAKAREYQRQTVATASTGNAASALAAMAAAAGIRAVIFMPADAPEAKLVQVLAYGAEVFLVAGNYDDAFELCLRACSEFGWYNRSTALNLSRLRARRPRRSK